MRTLDQPGDPAIDVTMSVRVLLIVIFYVVAGASLDRVTKVKRLPVRGIVSRLNICIIAHTFNIRIIIYHEVQFHI